MNQEQIGDVLVVSMPSRLDAASLAKIEPRFSAAAIAHRGKLLVDLSGVTFVASLALRMLLMAQKATRPLGGDMRLCGLEPALAEVFHKSRFDTLFTIYADRATALQAFAA